MINNSPHTGYVEEGEYQYYVYKATCEKCALLIALSTFTNGDPDLFINFGSSKLPTRNDYHIKSSTSLAEVIEISLDNKYFKNNNITSMKGTFVFGVYGQKNSTFTISITSEMNPMVSLIDGHPLKDTTPKFEIAYYNWYNGKK